MPNISKALNFYLFADNTDNTNIHYESETLQDLQKMINKELHKLHFWLNVTHLSFNLDKTKYIIFHPYNKPVKHCIVKINKKAINEKEFIKYLGVFIDSMLS